MTTDNCLGHVGRLWKRITLPVCVLAVLLCHNTLYQRSFAQDQIGNDGTQLPAATDQAQSRTADANDVDTAGGLSLAETIDAGLAQISSDSSLEETIKANLTDLLGKAKQKIAAENAHQQLVQRFTAMIDSVVDETKRLRFQSQSEAEENDAAFEDDLKTADVDVLTERLEVLKQDLQQAKATAASYASEPARRRGRLVEIPTLISEAERELGETEVQLGQAAPSNELPQETGTRALYLQASKGELNSRIEKLKQEQAAYVATTDLSPLQAKAAQATVQRLTRQVKKLSDWLTEKKQDVARATAEENRRTANRVPEAFRSQAQYNAALAEKQTGWIADAKSLQDELTRIESATGNVKAELKTSKERVDAVGLTDALGVMLRERREEFDALRFQFRPRDDLQERIEDYQIQLFEIEDELDEVNGKLQSSPPMDLEWDVQQINWSALSPAQSQWILLKKRSDLLEQSIGTQSSVLQKMLASDTQRRLLLSEIDRYRQFVDERLFWTRSSPVFSLSELESAPEMLRWLINPVLWAKAGAQMIRTVQRHPLTSFLLVGSLLFLFSIRSRMRRSIEKHGKRATRTDATYFATVRSLIATVGSACVWPLCFATFSFLLLATSTSEAFVHGLGMGLVYVAVFVASRQLLLDVCREQGLAQAHFGWSDELRSHLKRHLRWYILFGGLSLFLLLVFHDHPDAGVRTLGSRLMAAMLFIVTAIFHHAMFNNRSPVYTDLARVHPESILVRSRKAIWLVSVILPIVFGLLSIAGYLDTTFRLGQSLQYTFLLLVTVVLMLGLFARWLALHRRDVYRRRMIAERIKRSEEMEDQSTSSIASEAGIVIDNEEADLPTLDHQTRQLAVVIASIIGLVGLALIWSDVVPAIRFLDQIDAWTVGTGEEVKVVSYADLGYVVALVFGTIYIVKLLPSLLELLVLSRTGLDGGARYALTTLLRYAISIVGFMVVMNLLSVPYQQLGWLLTAASVGLGFGLQEIVANFVSGIILLLERPVRVGDVVTIDDTTGIVSRIQMRATTVTNWDRKELVIPNKDLITNKLINWTLTNVVNRLTIHIGVEYGCDPDVVRQILRDVIEAHPEIMDDPGPLISFETFGDSALNFVIRFYLAKLDNRIEVTHQINTAIAKALHDAGISIPFPQRDVHVFDSSKSSGEQAARGPSSEI